MRTEAVRLSAHSQPLTVESVELPLPGPGEVVVRLAYAGVNPVDRYQVDGRVAADGPLPRTLGTEGSGWAAGRAVVVRGHGLGTRRDGLWATAAVVPESALIPVPDGVDLAQAAVMGVAGVTAWRCAIEKAQLTPEDRVLVLGAAGGVGSMILSVARSIRSTVWGQTASPAKAAWILERGAADVVVGGADEVIERASGWRPTVVFDPLGGCFLGAAVKVLAEKGRIVSFGASAGPEGSVPLQTLYRKAITVHGYGGLIETDEALDEGVRLALDAVAAGRMEVKVDRVVPLEDVNTAIHLLTDRAILGKVVLGMGSEADQSGGEDD